MENPEQLINDVDTIIFADETKFSQNNGDIEDAVFYFGIAVNKFEIKNINPELNQILQDAKFQGSTFHSTSIFKESRPSIQLMKSLCQVFIKYKLHCFCYKYSKQELFEVSKILNSFNNDILNFNNPEFQAVFYFLIFLNTNLRDDPTLNFGKKYIMFFDRNVYGRSETDDFNFPDDRFVIKRMTFTNKAGISMLALPDFFGYLFRKAYCLRNSEDGNKQRTSTLSLNCDLLLKKLAGAGLFHFMNVNDETAILNQMFSLSK